MVRTIQQKASNFRDIIYQLTETTDGYSKTEMTGRGLNTYKQERYKQEE